MSTTKALVVLSGGQDSTTATYWAKAYFDEVHAITFDYGQRHKIEIESARKIAEVAGLASHEVIQVPGVLIGTSPLVSSDEPEQYEHWSKLPGGLEATFVPARNILFLTIAANRAYALGAPNIVTGVAQEDFGGYPDCRDVFILAMEEALRKGLTLSDKEVMFGLTICTPLIYSNKEVTVRLATTYPGCYSALQWSHTSYDGRYPPTGRDHATLLREKGFEQAGLPDPLVMRAYKEGLMELPHTSNYSAEAIEKYERLMSGTAD